VSASTFAAASAVRRRDAGGDGHGLFDATVDAAWTIGGKPNGGYLLAMLARAAGIVTPWSDPISATATYLRAPDPGPAVVDVETLRTGRKTSVVRAQLHQRGDLCVDATLITGELAGVGPTWDEGAPRRRPLDPATCRRVPDTTPIGVAVPLMDRIDLRLDGAISHFLDGRPRGRGELHGWLSLPEDEPFSPISLLFAVDALPPATFDIQVSGWVPTLSLTAYVRARPAPGAVQVLQRAQLIDDGRVDESCHVWDRTGRLVAQATQLAGVRFDRPLAP
jgi:hypothetical protein